MNFQKFDQLLAAKPNLGEIEGAAAVGDYRNSGCGDLYRIYLDVDAQGVIRDAKFTTTGCNFGIAALSLVCGLAKGRTVEEAGKITLEEIEAGVDGFPERRKVYPQSALDAMKTAIAVYKGAPKG